MFQNLSLLEDMLWNKCPVSALEAARTELEQEYRARSEMERAAFKEERRRMERQVRKLERHITQPLKTVLGLFL